MTNALKIHSADAVEFSLEIVGLGGRSHAFVIDWHIRLLFAVAWMIAVPFLLGVGNTWWQELFPESGGITVTAYLIILPTVFIYLFYHPILEVLMQGRTPGKRMAGIRIVTSDGKTPSIGAILIRNLFRLIDSLPGFYIIGIITTLTTKQHVRIGDLAAGTLLVYEDNINQDSLSEAASLALSSELSSQDQALLLEILERWKTLETKAQISIGARFLNKIGKPIPDENPIRQQSKFIHQQLLSLKVNR